MYHKKSLGQNFLIDYEIVDEIIRAGEISLEDKVLEIGPGKGFLTDSLINQAGQVLAVEKDEQLSEFCQNQFKADNFKVITGDVLDLDWQEILKQHNFLQYKLIANIPYYITGKILRLFLENSFQPEILVLMVQKEVAQRICEKPGRLGILSLSVQYFGKPEIVKIVTKEKFDPMTEVDSAILKIRVDDENRLSPENEKKFFRLVKMGFSNPRKTLVNNLSAGLHQEKSKIKKILDKISLEENVRAQALRIDDWKKLISYF